jgi:hypothetical protein
MNTDDMMDAVQSAMSRLIELNETLVASILITIEGYSATKIPIATSNLINSQFRWVQQNPGEIRGRIGYGASYAPFVHEAPGKLKGQNVPRRTTSGYVWDPAGEPKFLQQGIDLMINNDLETLTRINLSI